MRKLTFDPWICGAAMLAACSIFTQPVLSGEGFFRSTTRHRQTVQFVVNDEEADAQEQFEDDGNTGLEQPVGAFRRVDYVTDEYPEYQDESQEEAVDVPAPETQYDGGYNGFIKATDNYGGYGADGCTGIGCTHDGCCDDGCAPIACGKPIWQHRSFIFGDFLYLRATNADVAFGQPIDNPASLGRVPVGPVGVASPNYQPGFRVGFGVAIGCTASIVASYSHYESQTSDTINTAPPFAIESLLTYPTLANAAANSLFSTANYDIDFQLVDVDYKGLLAGGDRYVVNYLVGARYGQLDQNILVTQPITPGTTSVLTDVNFNGGGARIGLDGERFGRRQRLFVYGQGMASFLAGHVRASYVQSNTFALTQATTSWTDDRIVPILEYEVGLGWQGRRGHLRLKAGYMTAAWFNMVTVGNYIQAVQDQSYVSVDETVTFDGLTARAEWRW